MRIIRSIALPLAVATQLLAAGSARAQVTIHFRLGLPARPHLHLVRPGVQIVEGYPGAQVFYTDGSYWCRRQDGWYRARSPREDFYRVDDDDVPPTLHQWPGGPDQDFRPYNEERREEELRQRHLEEEAHERHEAHERQEAEERARRQHEHEEHEEHEHGFD